MLHINNGTNNATMKGENLNKLNRQHIDSTTVIQYNILEVPMLFNITY